MDDAHAQRSNVTALHLPARFRGSLANYQADIAVVVAMMSFRVTTFVRPVCVDFDYTFDNKQLKVGNMGKVAGWGLTTINGPRSQNLKVIDLPIVSIETCVNESPAEILGYINADKIYAGFKNENKGVCRGDSGGGLVFPNKDERSTPRCYLRGIVSTAPTSNEQCNVNFYTTFTQVLRHEHFMKQVLENGELPCKEESLNSSHRYTPHYSMDSETLNHGTVQRDSAGRLTYFELYVAMQADEHVEIWLIDKDHSVTISLDVGNENIQSTRHAGSHYVQRTQTPATPSSTQLRSYYIKVDNGTLQFGKEGDSTPLVSHYDDRFRSLDYFSFYHAGNNTSKIRYDCPHVTGSSSAIC